MENLSIYDVRGVAGRVPGPAPEISMGPCEFLLQGLKGSIKIGEFVMYFWGGTFENFLGTFENLHGGSASRIAKRQLSKLVLISLHWNPK